MVAHVILPLWSGLKLLKTPSFPLPTPAFTHFKIDNEVTTYFRHIDNFLSVLLQLTKVKFLDDRVSNEALEEQCYFN